MNFSIAFALIFLFIGISLGASVKVEEDNEEWKPPESFKSRYPYFLSGHDREGAPVFIAELGKWDVKTAFDKQEEDLLDKHATQMFLQWSKIGNEAEGSPGAVVIQDWDGFHFNQLAYPGVVNLILGQYGKFEKINRAPGIKHVYVVNANYLCRRIYDIGKPFLGDSANKFEVFGTNASKWKPVLLREIDPSEIPEFLGGSKEHKIIRAFP